jgi:hypothetical protein
MTVHVHSGVQICEWTLPPGTVRRMLGHANFATTMKLYGGLTAEALDKAAGALGDAFEPKKEDVQRV